ncbi:MAG: hypothetical protein II059_11385 [Clostridia bacterium]|nr:hypothetical protein [Clostridia bacterium]
MSEFDTMSRILTDTGLYSAEQGSVIYAELMAYAEGLDIYFGEAEELLRECFVSTAESYGLSLREQLFHRINFGITTEARRSRLLAALSVGQHDFNTEGMQKICDAFGVEGSFTFDISEMKITFECTRSMTEYQRSRLEDQMRVLMPCWCSFEVTIIN